MVARLSILVNNGQVFVLLKKLACFCLFEPASHCVVLAEGPNVFLLRLECYFHEFAR